MFRKYQQSATVYRKSATTSGSFTKTGFDTTVGTYVGHLKATSIQSSISNDAFQQQFVFTCDASADVREGDKLTIDAVDYRVMGVKSTKGIAFSNKKVLLSKV